MSKYILSEGGSGGHMLHPFNLPQVKTGKDLIDFFETAAKFVSKKSDNVKASDSTSIKFDGVNASIKLIDGPGGKEFALDRGSLKHLDIEGLTADKLPLRFSEGHGMIKVGKIMLDIFNQALPKIKPELEQLGMWDDPTKFFNSEFVWSKTNVVQYPEDFIAIHGINQFYEKTHSRTGEYRPGLTRPKGDDGKPIKDVATETSYEEAALETLKEKVRPIAKNFGFNLYTVVPTSRREDVQNIDFSDALSTNVSIRFDEKTISKPLGRWLDDRNMVNPRMKIVKLSDGRKITALSKFVYQAIMGGASLAELLVDPDDGQAAINGAIFYYATQLLGGVILDSLTSPLGNITGTETNHEGIVLRNAKLFGPRPVKITGDFITAGADSPFRKPEQVDPEQEEEETLNEVEEEREGLDINNPNVGRKIAVFPGKFKPPQKGHLDLVHCMIDKGADYVYILISPIPREIGNVSVGVAEAEKVWNLYLERANLLGRVSVIASPFNSPVQASYAVMDGDVPGFIPKAGDMIIPVASDKPDPRSGKPDYERFAKFHSYQPKIPGVIPANIRNYFVCALEDDEGAISATDFRNALENGQPIDRFVPEGINPDDVRMKLGFEPIENASLPGTLDRTGNEFNESLFGMIEGMLLSEGDWQPAAKRRTSAGHKKLIDTGRKDLTKYGAPFNVERPKDKSNAFFAKEAKDASKKQDEYAVIDTKTGDVVSKYKNKNSARTKRDELDLKHGSVRYRVELVKPEKVEEMSAMGAGAVEGGSGKSPWINFDPEENEQTT